ncbi:REP-associated tyrosine transposase [Duganella aceris]|uniref:Transposase n=1 Tax=Duganella aceris TaxID=2703883 RepID=A0ABX0FJT1_9BURK|nr:transposase [Duganella aceris]NGZ84828.1 transposase [Duganella aceris]
MARPLRLQFAGALYHVTARGDRRELIYLDDTDRAFWMQALAEVCARFKFVVHSFCQMGNHYHLLLETEQANLASGMQQLNGIYSQYFNRRHDLVGHVFQGRYHAVLVQKESYLLELARYIVLNPVRANLVKRPGDWPWSSYRLTTADASPPSWLSVQWTLEIFHSSRPEAIEAYRAFVYAGIGCASPFADVNSQLILGDGAFVARFQAPRAIVQDKGITRQHRRAIGPPLQAFLEQYPDRDEAIARAHATSSYTIDVIARHFKVSHKTAARAIKRWRGLLDG